MVFEAIKDFYYEMENKYYEFLDWLESKGIRVYDIVDALESNNIPSFPVFILLCLLLGGLILYLLLNFILPSTSIVTFVVKDKDGVPIKNAEISISFDDQKIYKNTDGEGKLEIQIPMNKTIKYVISKNEYEDYSGSKKILDTKEEINITLTTKIKTEKKTILFKDKEGKEINNKFEAFFYCSNNSSYSQTKSITNSRAEIEIPNNCGNLIVDVFGGFKADQQSFDASRSDIAIVLSPIETEKGNAIVSVVNLENTPLAGIEVSLVKVSSNGNIENQQKQITMQTGTIEFSNINEGLYCIVAYDPTGYYAEYDSCKIEKKQVEKNKTTIFSVVLEKKTVGKIKIIVKNKANLQPIENAEVSLYKNKTFITKSYTGEDGKLEFNVGEDIPYSITIDKVGFIIETLSNIKRSEDYYEVLLTEATLNNSTSLKVKVIDEKRQPIEDVRLKLFDLRGNQVGDELLTGLDGIAIFERLENGTYKVYATKPGYDEKYTDEIRVENRKQNEVEISLTLGFGNIEITVYDDKDQPLPGATVKLVDYYSNNILGEKNTNKDGKAIFSERSDKTIYAVISAPSYAKYVTVPTKMAKDVTRKINVSMPKSITKLEILEEGIFLGNEQIQSPYELTPGQQYLLKLKLNIPENYSFSEAGIFVRTGNDESKTIQTDNIYIKDIKGAYNLLRKGTTYNPPSGYSQDMKNLTSSDSKWVNALINNPLNGGCYEMEITIVVKDSASLGSSAEIRYRAYAKSNFVIRDPVDNELGNNESVATKQGLYANSKLILASIGPTTLCTNDFCYYFMIEDTKTKTRTFVVENYEAEIGNNYKLLIGAITKQGGDNLGEAYLKIENNKKSILFKTYAIKNTFGTTVKGDAQNYAINIPIGDLYNGASVGGNAEGVLSYIEFSPIRDGLSEILINIVSKEGDILFEKILRIDTKPPKEFNVEIIPKVIVPYIQNNLLVIVRAEDLPVEQALVTIKKDNEIINQGITDKQGIYAYSLVSMNPGNKITIEVEKEGYRKKIFEIIVSEKIVELLPEKIETNFIIGKAHELENELIVRNISLIPLTIENIEISKELIDYLTVNYDGNNLGKIIDINKNLPIKLLFTLTDKAILTDKQTNLEGTIIITLSNKDLGKRWNNLVRLNARIGFGDGVDSIDCLALDTPVWDITTSTNTVPKTITISNMCTVDNTPVALKNLEVRLIGKTLESGILEAYAPESNVGNIEIKNVPQKIISSLAPSAQTQINLEFTPNVITAKEEIELEISAKHNTKKGIEIIKNKIKLNITVNRLNECIKINPTSMNLDSLATNIGYDYYGNYFGQGYNTYGLYNYYTPYTTDPNASFAAAAGYHYGGSPEITTPLTTNTATTVPLYTTNYGGIYYPYTNTYPYGNQLANYYYPYYSSYGYNYPYSFPNQYYYPNILGTGFLGNPNLSTVTSAQKAGTVSITNNCATPVEINLKGDEGIITKENNFTIEQGQSKDVIVQPNYPIGLYTLEINAKTKGSKDSFKKIGEVRINVENELIKGYKDCLSIDPPSTLKFNTFIGKGVYISVINRCFNQGVRLIENNSGINFFPEISAAYPGQPYGSGLYPAPPYGPLTSNEPLATPADIQRLVSNWAYVGTKYQTSQDGTVTQIVTYRIIKNVAYIQDAPKFPEGTDTPFATIAGLRYFITRGYYAIKANTMLEISFIVRTGMMRKTYFPITIEDWWEAMPYGERLIKFGDPTYKPEQCIPQEEGYNLDFTSEYPNCLYEKDLSKEFKRNMIKLARRDQRGNEVEGCGSMDRIIKIEPTVIEKNGLKFILNITESGKAIRLIIRGWEKSGNWTGAFTEINEPIKITIKRAYFYTQEKTITTNLKICVNGKEVIPPTEPSRIAACPVGETGNEAYKKYGFDRLLLSWSESDINKDSCDSNNDDYKFCDGVQFGLSLIKKNEILKKIVDKIKQEKECAVNDDLNKCEEYKNSRELFRWVLERIKIRDDSIDNKEKYIFFFKDKEDNIIEDDDAIEILGELTKDVVDKNLTNATYREHLEYLLYTEPTLDKIANSPYREQILILLNKDKFGSLGEGDKWIDDIGTNYAITFNEYYAAFKETVKQYKQGGPRYGIIELADEPLIINNRITITVTNLRKILESLDKVVIGITATPNISKDAKEKLMKEAKPRISLEGYQDVLELYKDLVEFKAMLINDGYSEDFANDFTNSYGAKQKETGIGFNKWVFGKIEKTGEYEIINLYSWDNEQIKIQIIPNISRELKQININYSKNMLLYLPLDGDLGYTNDRIGYGTSYVGNMPIPSLYFNNNNYLSMTNGDGWIKINAKYEFDKTFNNPRILTITSQNILFSPKDPIYLRLKLVKTSPVGNSAGILYILRIKGQTQLEFITPGIIKWNIIKDEINNRENISIGDMSINLNALCPGNRDAFLPGIITNGKPGTMEMYSILYAPTDVKGTGNTEFIISCIKDSGMITIKDVIAKSTTTLSSNVLGSYLNANKTGSLRLIEDYSLSSIIKMIKTNDELPELVCVDAKETSTSFYWNTSKIKEINEN